MRRVASPTDRASRAPLSLATAVGALLALIGAASAVAHRGLRGFALFAAGLCVLALRWVAPRAVLAVATPIHRALGRVGEAIGTVALIAIYLALVWPYRLVLRALGLVAPPDEPWPPTGVSGWEVVSASQPAPWMRRARPGSVLARLAVRVGGAVALVRYLRRRPSFFVVPLVVLFLLLGAVVLFGNATGLGPLIYTLF